MLPPKPEILTLLLPVSTTASAKKLKKKNNPGVCFINIFEREINLNQSQTESDDFRLWCIPWFQVCNIWRRSLGRPHLQHEDCPSWACLRRQQKNWVELTLMSSSATVLKPHSWISSAPPFTDYRPDRHSRRKRGTGQSLFPGCTEDIHAPERTYCPYKLNIFKYHSELTFIKNFQTIFCYEFLNVCIKMRIIFNRTD